MTLTRLVLILALDLQDVEEVGGRSVDLDQIVMGARLGVRQLGDGELFGALWFVGYRWCRAWPGRYDQVEGTEAAAGGLRTYFDILGNLDAAHRVGGWQQGKIGVAPGGVLEQGPDGKLGTKGGCAYGSRYILGKMCTTLATRTGYLVRGSVGKLACGGYGQRDCASRWLHNRYQDK